jgi:hypothetical protein
MTNAEIFFAKASAGLKDERSVQVRVLSLEKWLRIIGIVKDGDVLELTPSTSQGAHETQRIFVNLEDFVGVSIS